MTQAKNIHVPPGMQLVPIEPTESMIVQGFESWPHEGFSKFEEWEAYCSMSGCQQAAHRAKLCYEAMLAAAPSAPLVAVSDNVDAMRDALQRISDGNVMIGQFTHAETVLAYQRIAQAGLSSQASPQATPCNRCNGEGVTHTGIDESPTTQCSKCDGTGITNQQATVEPLTDEQIDTLISRHGSGGWQMMSDMRRFARAVLALATPPTSKATEQAACPYCDGTGDVHDQTGEWRGTCTCGATSKADTGEKIRNAVLEEARQAIKYAVINNKGMIAGEKTGLAFAEIILEDMQSATPSTIVSEAERICEHCHGEGLTHSGITESPTSQCDWCDGTGFTTPSTIKAEPTGEQS